MLCVDLCQSAIDVAAIRPLVGVIHINIQYSTNASQTPAPTTSPLETSASLEETTSSLLFSPSLSTSSS